MIILYTFSALIVLMIWVLPRLVPGALAANPPPPSPTVEEQKDTPTQSDDVLEGIIRGASPGSDPTERGQVQERAIPGGPAIPPRKGTSPGVVARNIGYFSPAALKAACEKNGGLYSPPGEGGVYWCLLPDGKLIVCGGTSNGCEISRRGPEPTVTPMPPAGVAPAP